MTKTDLLRTDVERYITTSGIGRLTALQYRKSVSCYSEYLTRPARRPDLVEDRVNSWLTFIADGLAPCTTRNRKRGITALWNWLATRGDVAFYNPRALRRIRVPKKPPAAWTIQQVRQLLAGADSVSGQLRCGIDARDLMRAWVLMAYETGLRPSDMFRLRWSELDGERLAICQHKTAVPHVAVLSKDTVAAVEKLRNSNSTTIFILRKGGMRRWELLLFAAAREFGFNRRIGQSSGTLRKTAATETARVAGVEAAARLLGHRSGTQVVIESYIQPDAIAPNAPPQALINALSGRGNLPPHRSRKAAG